MENMKVTLAKQSKKINPITNKKDITRKVISDNTKKVIFKNKIEVKKGNEEMIKPLEEIETSVRKTDEIVFNISIVRDNGENKSIIKINDDDIDMTPVKEDRGLFNLIIHRKNDEGEEEIIPVDAIKKAETPLNILEPNPIVKKEPIVWIEEEEQLELPIEEFKMIELAPEESELQDEEFYPEDEIEPPLEDDDYNDEDYTEEDEEQEYLDMIPTKNMKKLNLSDIF